MLGASGWSWSLVSLLIGAGFGLAALLLPGRIAAGVCLAIGAAVLAPAVSRGDDATQLVTLVAELGVAAIFAFAVRSSIVTLRRHETAVLERNQDLANVHEAGQRLTRTMTSDDLCREVARATRGITGAAYARLVVTSPDGRRIVLIAASGQDGESVVSGPRAPEFEVGASRGLALESGDPVRIGPAAPSPVAVPAWYPVAPTYLAVPIVVDGERRGELVAAGKAGGSFTPICQTLLSIYAVEASAALEGRAPRGGGR